MVAAAIKSHFETTIHDACPYRLIEDDDLVNTSEIKILNNQSKM